MKQTSIIGIVAALIIVAAGGYWWWSNQQATNTVKLSGTIEIDGSSTVFPITQAVAEEFQKINSDVRINVGISGTGGGFKRFTKGETDISDASRPISSSEVDLAKMNKIGYVELKIALDGIAVVVNPKNTWVDYLTTAELKLIWNANSTVTKWSDVRASWPDQPIHLYGPGTDSGTFDYFTEVINGKTKASRADFTASEDDNILVQGVSGDPNSLGYFGYAYFVENKAKLKDIPIDSGSGPIAPNDSTITSNEYKPLSRPLFIYVNTAALKRAEVKAFIEFYMQNGEVLVHEVGYTPLAAQVYKDNLSTIKNLP
jgi:phosphate transport system substrate-binding protein